MYTRTHTHSFGQSTAKTATYFVLLLVIGEYTFAGTTTALWNSYNYGRTFETADWSSFDEVDEDEEEEENDDDDDDE